MELTDQELLDAWQRGSEWAFEQIYKRQTPILLAHAMRKTNDRTVSEELVQDTLMVFYKLNPKTLTINSLPAYLYTILKNKVLMHYRQGATLRKYQIYLEDSQHIEAFSDDFSLELKELENYINNNINKLPEQCQRVFKLSRHDQLSNKEIALQLNISENTVEQHMRKALRLLRGSMIFYARIVLLVLLFRYK